jgi:hypothetical protein
MVEVLDPAVVNWNAPTWVTSELVDFGCIEHRVSLGEVVPDAADDRFVVEVIQRDELDITTDPISITRMTPHVSVAGIWLRADQARELARVLSSPGRKSGLVLWEAHCWRVSKC